MALVSLICSGCSTPFTRTSRSLHRESRRFFCSHTCYSTDKRVGYINSRGYRAFTVGGKEVLEHRSIMEKHLGRKLLPTEDVHHLNGKKTDNRVRNLGVLPKREHTMEHFPLGWDIETAKAMKAEGRTLEEIGQRFGITKQAVWSAFKHRGLTRRYRPAA